MFEFPVNHPALAYLFDPHVPNNPALWAVFHGWHAGRAVVDDLQSPTQCLLRTEALLTYASKGMSQLFLAKAIAYFIQFGPVWLVRSAGNPSAPTGNRILARLEFFEYDPNSSTLAELRNCLPDYFEMKTIDIDLLERCEWRDDMAFYAGSLDNFLKHDLGLCLMHGNEILVEAYASAFGDKYSEIGAITHEPYRGKGYAPIAVSYLIKAVEQRGYQAYWSCDVDNLASAKVARKLGFRVERPYEIWEYGS
jgi:GNAT superfamily N-acetyltransferase